jgi:hypothetical protein
VTTRQFIERYGVTLGVVAALLVAIAVVPGNTKSGGVAAGPAAASSGNTYGSGAVTPGGGVAPGASGSGSAAAGVGATGSSGGTPVAGGAAVAQASRTATGTATNVPGASGPDVVWGSGPHCRADGRQMGVSYGMPPCVTWKGTDNGPPSQGVTKDKVLVVRYLPQIDPGTRAILQSSNLSDPPATVERAYQAFFRYGNLHNETYGRQVVFQDFAASGSPTNDEASRADAIQISEVIKPFAVIDGDPAQGAPVPFIKEIARRNILCLCSTSDPSSMYTSLPARVFSPLPTEDEYVNQVGEYICKKVAGKPANFGGVGTQGKPRVFGLIYLTGQNEVVYPEWAAYKPLAEQAFARCGLHFAVEIGYSYDPGRNQSDVTNMIAQLKAAGVTTVVPFWDPLYPILITGEATRQIYFPEWFMTGTGLSDTTTAGRLYDQQQWKHAFGVSPLWVTWATVAKSAGYREYHWARPQDPPGAEGVLVNIYRSRIAELFTIIQMAGPQLNEDTAAAGAFAYPHTGGSPGRPLLFRTRQAPTAIKDFSEVWYDAGAQGPDERGQNGTGMIRRANGGQRYQLGQWTVGNSAAFVLAGSVTVTDSPVGGGDWPSDSDPNAYPASQRCLDCG